MPKIVDHDLFRRELLSKSMPIFAAKGVSGVTIRELASGLSVSTGTLYHYFATKEILFSSMVQFLVEKDATEISELSREKRGIQDIVDYVASKEEHFINLILLALDVRRHHTHSPELTELLDESWNSYAHVLRRFFEEQEDGRAGEAFLSFFVGALFLKFTRSTSIGWNELLEGLGQVSDFSNIFTGFR